MKLITYYDLIDKIQDAKEKPEILYMLKSNLKTSARWFFIYTALNLATGDQIDHAIEKASFSASALFLCFSATGIIKQKLLGDITRAEAIKDLTELSHQLGEANISTSVILLLESVAYSTKYKINFNEKKFPYILQEKYIMIPTYANGNIKETSILQEHEIGSKEYVLSLGSPTRVLKPAFSNI